MKKLFLFLIFLVVNIDANNLEKQLLNTLNIWNKAINQRDYYSLYDIYSNKVAYYGKIYTKRECIKDKKNFLKKRPYFSQFVQDVSYDYYKKNIYKLYFTKYVKLTKNGKIKVYPSYLFIDLSYDTPKIILEGDRVTDVNLLFN